MEPTAIVSQTLRAQGLRAMKGRTEARRCPRARSTEDRTATDGHCRSVTSLPRGDEWSKEDGDLYIPLLLSVHRIPFLLRPRQALAPSLPDVAPHRNRAPSARQCVQASVADCPKREQGGQPFKGSQRSGRDQKPPSRATYSSSSLPLPALFLAPPISILQA